MKMRDEFGPSYSAGVGSHTAVPTPPKPREEELFVSDEYKIFIIVNAVDPDTQRLHPIAVRPFHLMPPDALGKMLPIAKPCSAGKCAGIDIWPNGQTLMFSDETGVTVETFPVSELDPEVRDRIQNADGNQDPFTASLWKKYLDAASNVVRPEPQIATGSTLPFRKPITLKRNP